MPDARRVTCKRCHGRTTAVGPITWRGYCIECAKHVESTSNDQQHFHSGPVFEKWRRAMAACVGGALLDDDGGTA